MKLANNNNLHLTYCTNIHSGETWSEVFHNLKQYLPQLKTRLSPNHAFGVGLRLADIAAKEILTGDNLVQFKNWLESEDLYIFTLNGFPYGEFHHQVIKDKVYTPDWTKPERFEYSLRLIKILTELLPQGIDGGISTVPLSYKPWWQNSEQKEKVLHQSSLYLTRAVGEMAEVYQKTGKLIHIDLEPEPDGMVENSQEVISFFQDWLLPVGQQWLHLNSGVSHLEAENLIRQHIRVCYDTCHFAIEYEEPQDIIQSFKDAEIKIGKIQLSSAIKINIPPETAQRQQILEKLTPFAESTYLHQVIARYSDGKLERYGDLSAALEHLIATEAKEWRTHFHVPIFLANYKLFESTQDCIAQLLHMLPNDNIGNHLEIETYTWEVLPPEMKLDIMTSIEREYQWVLSKIDN